MYKNTCLLILLVLWTGSIFTPAITSMVQEGEKTGMVMSAAEEEHKEQAKDATDDKKFSENSNLYSLLSRMPGDSENYFYFQPLSNKSSIKIILPPPEQKLTASI